MSRNKPTAGEPEKDPNEEFVLIDGNWVSNMFGARKMTVTRRELLGKGFSPEALLKQRLIRANPKPAPAEPAPETPAETPASDPEKTGTPAGLTEFDPDASPSEAQSQANRPAKLNK